MKNVFTVIIFAVFLYFVSALCIFTPKEDYSLSERRALAKMPKLTMDVLVNGEFARDFEQYSTDNFPMRDRMRSVKANFATKILNKQDNNGLFASQGHISKIDDEINYDMLDLAAKKFESIAEKNFGDENTKLYFSIVPDKNMYIANKNGYPSMDYKHFADAMRQRVDFMEYIDIAQLLDENDYYYTDTHWRQENIQDVAEHLASSMGQDAKAEYKVNTLDIPFQGVYVGQYAMNVQPDTIRYLTNDIIENAVVTYYDTGMPKKGDMYSMEKAKGKDAYEMFLSGAMPIATIENPNADTDKELIMFRDSYGSSLAPLLVPGYSKITVVDIRYVESGMLGMFLKAKNADVLFIYSTALLNNSTALR